MAGDDEELCNRVKRDPGRIDNNRPGQPESLSVLLRHPQTITSRLFQKTVHPVPALPWIAEYQPDYRGLPSLRAHWNSP